MHNAQQDYVPVPPPTPLKSLHEGALLMSALSWTRVLSPSSKGLSWAFLVFGVPGDTCSALLPVGTSLLLMSFEVETSVVC